MQAYILDLCGIQALHCAQGVFPPHWRGSPIGAAGRAAAPARLLVRIARTANNALYTNGGATGPDPLAALVAEALGVAPEAVAAFPRHPDLVVVPVVPEGVSLDDAAAWVRQKLQQVPSVCAWHSFLLVPQ